MTRTQRRRRQRAKARAALTVVDADEVTEEPAPVVDEMAVWFVERAETHR